MNLESSWFLLRDISAIEMRGSVKCEFVLTARHISIEALVRTIASIINNMFIR